MRQLMLVTRLEVHSSTFHRAGPYVAQREAACDSAGVEVGAEWRRLLTLRARDPPARGAWRGWRREPGAGGRPARQDTPLPVKYESDLGQVARAPEVGGTRRRRGREGTELCSAGARAEGASWAGGARLSS